MPQKHSLIFRAGLCHKPRESTRPELRRRASIESSNNSLSLDIRRIRSNAVILGPIRRFDELGSVLKWPLHQLLSSLFNSASSLCQCRGLLTNPINSD
jgi:hypothetical protein